MQTIVIDTEPVLEGTCLNSYNVNVKKNSCDAMYPLAVKVYKKCCGACGDCKGKNCNNAEEIVYGVGFR